MNKLFVGDSASIMRSEIPDKSVSLIVGSPPYDGIRIYNGFNLDLHAIGAECFRVLEDGGILALVINDGTKDFGKSLTTYRTILDYCDGIGFKLFENIIYSRHGRPGAWWNKRFRVDHEYILIFLKGDRPKYFNKEPLKIDAIHAGEDWHGTQRLSDGSLVPIKKTIQSPKKCRGTIWKYSSSNSEGNKTKMLHPATFPDKLAEDLILCFSAEGGVVLDPFVGSGTSAVMAKKNRRQYIGIDVSEEYINIAEARLATENGKDI